MSTQSFWEVSESFNFKLFETAAQKKAEALGTFRWTLHLQIFRHIRQNKASNRHVCAARTGEFVAFLFSLLIWLIFTFKPAINTISASTYCYKVEFYCTVNWKIVKQFQFSLSDLENVSPELTEPSLGVCVGPFCIRTQQVCVSVRRPPFCSETVLNVFESIIFQLLC